VRSIITLEAAPLLELEINPRTPFYASLGLAAALDLAFFGVRASWIFVVGGDTEQPFPLCSAWSLRSAWSSSACLRAGLPLPGETPEPPFSATLGPAAVCARACCVVS
jgi:hypothetical protein